MENVEHAGVAVMLGCDVKYETNKVIRHISHLHIESIEGFSHRLP